MERLAMFELETDVLNRPRFLKMYLKSGAL